jgi:glycosyltransferase involved in cell wall biosynthesis
MPVDPKISVVVPVFNRQASGVLAIKSIVQQTETDCEIIVIDDGSKVPFKLPADIAADRSIKLIRHDVNGGAAAARNTGVLSSRGKWIAFLDSDDIWLPGKLRAQLAFAERGIARGWHILTCVMTGFLQVNLANGKSHARIPVESWSAADFAAGCWFAPGSTGLVPKLAFERIGLLDETLPRLEDLDWYLRLALAGGGVATLQEVAAEVHVGGAAPVEHLDRSVDLLQRKWLGSDAPVPLPLAVRNNLAAYLALEQAKVRFHSGHHLSGLAAMARSLFIKPRMRVPLRDWWAVPSPTR